MNRAVGRRANATKPTSRTQPVSSVALLVAALLMRGAVLTQITTCWTRLIRSLTTLITLETNCIKKPATAANAPLGVLVGARRRPPDVVVIQRTQVGHRRVGFGFPPQSSLVELFLEMEAQFMILEFPHQRLVVFKN